MDESFLQAIKSDPKDGVVVQFIELRSLCSLVRHKLKLP